MPDYRAVIIKHGRETQVRVGSLESVVRWAEQVIQDYDVDTVRISKVDKEDDET